MAWTSKRDYCPLCYSEIKSLIIHQSGIQTEKKLEDAKIPNKLISNEFLLQKCEFLLEYTQNISIKTNYGKENKNFTIESLKELKQILLLNNYEHNYEHNSSTLQDLWYYDTLIYLISNEKWSEIDELDDNFDSTQNNYEWKVIKQENTTMINEIPIVSKAVKKKKNNK